jgi:hypothetical protein
MEAAGLVLSFRWKPERLRKGDGELRMPLGQMLPKSRKPSFRRSSASDVTISSRTGRPATCAIVAGLLGRKP